MESQSDGFPLFSVSLGAAEILDSLTFELRLALSIESNSEGFTMIFHRFGRRSKSGLAGFELRLALSMESK